MAVFKEDPEEWRRLDWQLLQNSPITLYVRQSVLEADIAWFNANEYRVLALEVTENHSPEGLLLELGQVLEFPNYYGRNLNAFNDCLSDVEVPHSGGLVLALRQFDTFSRSNYAFAQRILDICAKNCRRFLLTGRRFIVLVQSNDPRVAFEAVGATEVAWNPQEWLSSRRGL
jgi:RNAse (barnase) inhibitor barstar